VEQAWLGVEVPGLELLLSLAILVEALRDDRLARSAELPPKSQALRTRQGCCDRALDSHCGAGVVAAAGAPSPRKVHQLVPGGNTRLTEASLDA
jgi:hypothetical protein